MACCHVSERLLTIVCRNVFANKEFPEINYQKDHSFTVVGPPLFSTLSIQSLQINCFNRSEKYPIESWGWCQESCEIQYTTIQYKLYCVFCCVCFYFKYTKIRKTQMNPELTSWGRSFLLSCLDDWCQLRRIYMHFQIWKLMQVSSLWIRYGVPWHSSKA